MAERFMCGSVNVPKGAAEFSVDTPGMLFSPKCVFVSVRQPAADAPLVSEIFYFPLWLGIALFALILIVSLIFGILPARSLLRKTPSEILSKYDI
jgi:hypothetical protein